MKIIQRKRYKICKAMTSDGILKAYELIEEMRINLKLLNKVNNIVKY